ncbi:MAG: ATP-binding protein, partial [Bacillota bacterium]
DNGEGIPAQHLKRLGERFFTTKATGTGIGLAVTYRIVRKYRGRIQVASVPGEGTEFTVTLHVWTDPGSGGASA